MSGTSARLKPVAFLLAGVLFLAVVALRAPSAAEQLIAFPFAKVLFEDLRDILGVGVAGYFCVDAFRRFRRARAALAAPASPMADVRRTIDDLDAQLVTLLATRQRQIEAAAKVKRANGIPALVPERVDEVLGNVAAHAAKQNLDGELAKSLWTKVINWSIAYEERLMREAAEKDRT